MSNTVADRLAPPLPIEAVRDHVRRFDSEPGALLTILEQLQQRHPQRYLPRQTLRDVARETGLPLAQIISVATFYAFFNADPQGRHTLRICRGTACHARGSRALLKMLNATLGGGDSTDKADKTSFTTPDMQYTVRTVACFGQCAMAPVIEIDHRMLGHVNRQTLATCLEQLQHEEVES